MLSSQKHLFQLPAGVVYLNGAYMSPLLSLVEEAGMKGMAKKRNPASISAADFFTEATETCHNAAAIINAPPGQVALIPSASYGLKTVANNLPLNNGNHAIAISHEFPSVYYTIQQWCKTNNKELRLIPPPYSVAERGKKWNEVILESINNDTAVVMLSAIHWTNGTLFDLEKIGKRCREVNALFVVDGTQSVGALPMDVRKCHIDALVCAGYKWLLGPYSTGFVYVSEYFNNGAPLEVSWMNRSNAEDFTRLTSYVDTYMEGAARYNVGEFSNFILTPMLNTALLQILDWNVSLVQEYSRTLIAPLIKLLKEKDFWVEDENFRANHLFGFLLPKTLNPADVLTKLREKQIYVSTRGEAIRVSAHVYNTEEDIETFAKIVAAL
jgi:selenocysteine lyase/cysteine desulfurase